MCFTNATFDGRADFISSRFFKGASFLSSRFNSGLIITDCIVGAKILFSNIKFPEYTLIRRPLLGNGYFEFTDSLINSSSTILIESFQQLFKPIDAIHPRAVCEFIRVYNMSQEANLTVKDCKIDTDKIYLIKMQDCMFERGSCKFIECEINELKHYVDFTLRGVVKSQDAFIFQNCKLPTRSIGIGLSITSFDGFDSLKPSSWEILLHIMNQFVKHNNDALRELNNFNLDRAVNNNEDLPIEDILPTINSINLNTKSKKDLRKNLIYLWKNLKKLNNVKSLQFFTKLIKNILLNKDFLSGLPSLIEGFSKQHPVEEARRLKEKYAFLKKKAEENGDKQLAAHYHFNQLHWFNKETFNLVNWLYWLTCGYGLSILRPFFWFIFCIFLFTTLNQSILWAGTKCFGHHDLSFLMSLTASSFGVTPYNLIESFIEELTSWQIGLIFVLYFVQKTIQYFFIFEIGSAIRNKVKK